MPNLSCTAVSRTLLLASGWYRCLPCPHFMRRPSRYDGLSRTTQTRASQWSPSSAVAWGSGYGDGVWTMVVFTPHVITTA